MADSNLRGRQNRGGRGSRGNRGNRVHHRDDRQERGRQNSGAGIFGVCICPLENCLSSFVERNAFFSHLCTSHSNYFVNKEKYRYMMELFATTYFLFDTQVPYSRFVHICKLCQKHCQDDVTQVQVKTSVDEDSIHILDHFAIPQFFCRYCKVWLNSRRMADQHNKTVHGNQAQPLHGDGYFVIEESKSAWKLFTGDLSKTQNSSFENIYQINRARDDCDIAPGEEMPVFVRYVMQNERNLKSLEDFKDHYFDIFKAIGDKQFIGMQIMSATAKTIHQCCDEVEKHVTEMLFHRRAASPLVSLLMRSTAGFWNKFVDVVRDNRSQIYNSLYAAHAIRRLMATEVNGQLLLPDDKASALGHAFVVNNQLDPELANAKFAGYLYLSIAARHDTPAILLARYFADNYESIVFSQHKNNAYKSLIKTAKKDPQNRDYCTFLAKTVSVFDKILETQASLYIADSMIYNAPEYCRNQIDKIVCTNFIFETMKDGNKRYQHGQYSELIQTAIVVSEPERIYGVFSSMQNFEIGDLLADPNANHILRRMAEMMVNSNLLQLIFDRVSVAMNSALRMHPDNKNITDCVNAIYRRLKIVQEQERNLGIRQG